jgi:hypothetical protein
LQSQNRRVLEVSQLSPFIVGIFDRAFTVCVDTSSVRIRYGCRINREALAAEVERVWKQ